MVALCYSEVKQSRKVTPLPYAGQGDIGKTLVYEIKGKKYGQLK